MPLTQLSQHPTLLPSTFLNFLDFLLVALREAILGVGFWLASRWASTSRFLSLGFAFSAKLRVQWCTQQVGSPHQTELTKKKEKQLPFLLVEN